MKLSRLHTLLTATALIAASLTLTACGDDDDDEPASSSGSTVASYNQIVTYYGTTVAYEANDDGFESADSYSSTVAITYSLEFNTVAKTLTITCQNFSFPGYSMPSLTVTFPNIPAVYNSSNFTFSATQVEATVGGALASEIVDITEFSGSGSIGTGATLEFSYTCAVKGSVNKTLHVRAYNLSTTGL